MPDAYAMNRRALMAGAAGAGLATLGATLAPTRALAAAEPMAVVEGVGTELVLNIVATCSDMEPTGGADTHGWSKDGVRDEVWPIIGGRFWGKDMRGTVLPGGADLPYTRPDKVEVVDAFYRLRTDDGVTIAIHNKGLTYPPIPGHEERYRMQPEFFAPAGKYDWLNRAIFVATLVFPVPPEMAMAKGPHENDRLIQVYRIT